MRIALGIVYTILLLLVGFWFVGEHFMTDSVAPEVGISHVRGISAEVTIDRDSFGIPNIHGATESDAYYGLGYAMAQDRLFQMEMYRRIGEGRLSELFGQRTLVVDAWARTIGFKKLADELWARSTPQTRMLFQAYSNGVNGYVHDRGGASLGFAFDALGLHPAPWRPEECYLVGRLMAWQMNFSYLTDASWSAIANTLDSTHLAALFPGYPASGATTIEGGGQDFVGLERNVPSIKVSDTLATKPASRSIPKNTSNPHHSTANPARAHPSAPAKHANPELRRVAPPPMPKVRKNVRLSTIEAPSRVMAALHDVEQEIASIGMVPMPGGGSNSFAIAPSKTRDHSAILENDMHLELRAPASWYIAHLRSDDGLNVAGFLAPGLPLFISGRTATLSWGVTNAMADESDFFIEPKPGADSGYTPHFETSYDTILVKDSSGYDQPNRVSLRIRRTAHGPVVSDFSPFELMRNIGETDINDAKDTTIFHNSRAVSLAWNGNYVLGDEASGFIRLTHAKTISEARQAVATIATPCLNMCLASKDGAIAYQFVGRLPRRRGAEDRLMLPRDAGNRADDWNGFITSSEMPSSMNPTRGFLVSANNPPWRGRTFPIGDNWEPSSRADRLTTMLDTAKSVDDAWVRSATVDIISPYADRTVLPYLLKLYRDPTLTTARPDSSAKLWLDSLRKVWRQDSIERHAHPLDSLRQPQQHVDSARDTVKPRSADTAALLHADPFTAQILDYLRNWDGAMRTEDIAPTIYSAFLLRLLQNTFADELGGVLYSKFMYVGNVPLRSLARILPDSTNIWWDDALTPTIEHRDEIILRSFREALRILAQSFGPDIRTWRWGRLHTLTLEHPFGKARAIIAKLVNIDVGAMPGGLATVMQGSYQLAQPYTMKVGPSMRMIADMHSSELQVILPNGNSESIFGRHYRDMIPLYKAGALITVPLTTTDPSWSRYTLIPE